MSLSVAASVSPKSPKPSESSAPRTGHTPSNEVHVTQKQLVDEDHPTVQELVEAGYNVEQSIEAVEHYERLEEAMDYLLRTEGEGRIFQTSMSVSSKRKQRYQEERYVGRVHGRVPASETLYILHTMVSFGT